VAPERARLESGKYRHLRRHSPFLPRRSSRFSLLVRPGEGALSSILNDASTRANFEVDAANARPCCREVVYSILRPADGGACAAQPR
jgi:hypothetical protein